MYYSDVRVIVRFLFHGDEFLFYSIVVKDLLECDVIDAVTYLFDVYERDKELPFQWLLPNNF